MFGFGKKSAPPVTVPALCRSNPGIGAEARTAFANGERTWEESVNLEWARQTIDMDDFMAQVHEIEKTGGRELKDFIADVEAVARSK